MIAKVVSHYQGIAEARSATIDTRDGIRIDLPEGWVQVRGSNTEPIVRVMSESKDETAAIKLADELKEVANL
jgi:phosphomannomutase